MLNQPSEELVFSVSGNAATPLDSVAIASLHFLERQHLQEWVLAQPGILGDDILIITFEFDQWNAASGQAPRDRLDVLGLGADGRLVIAELKRGTVPDTVDLQAIKYAAMASRFDEPQLAKLHADFVNREEDDGTRIDEDKAAEKMSLHVESGLGGDNLLSPRIVILAEGFSPTVTSSVVWLNEQGVDITLKQYKAYRTASGENILTVSQFYPVAEVAAFEVSPRLRRDRPGNVEQLPVVPWTEEDLALLQNLDFPMPNAVLDLCSKRPTEWIGSSDVYREAGVDQKSGMGRMAGFGYSVRRRFKRSNPPWSTEWAQGGIQQAYYSVDHETAARWLLIRNDPTEHPPGDQPL